ncbi:unnamed protein product [Bathycoccus prasinos]
MEKSNNNNTNDNINLTFASLHALSAWLSVKSIVKTTTVILEKTTTQLVVPGGDGAGKSMFSLAHAAMCLLNMLRSSVKTYREIRNTNTVKSRRKKKKNKKRNGFGGFKRKEKLRFLRNTQTSANDAKSALERANEALFTADAVLDTDDFDLDYDEEETNRMNLKSLGALALSGVFGHVNDEFKDGRYPTAKERQLMRRFVDAVTSASFGAALRVTAGMAWSLDDKIGRNHRAIETVFVASRAMEKEKRKEASKGLGLEGLTTRFRSNDVNSNNGSNSSSRKEASKSRNTSRGESSSSSASPFNRWRKSGGGRNETKKKPPVVNSSLSKATKQKMKIVGKKDFKRPAVVNPKDTFGTRRLLFPSSSTKTNNNTTKAKRVSSRAAKTTTTKENNNNNKNNNRATGVEIINRKDAKRAQDDCTWFERARERLPRVAPVILILAGFVL